MNDGPEADISLVPRWEPAAFGAGLLLGLVGTFRFAYFPSWDGPAHAASAYGMWHYHGAIATVFRRDWFPSPNLVAHLYESVLLTFTGPATADRVVAMTCVVAVALSIRFLCRSVSPHTGTLVSYVGLPIAFGWFLHGGQYSFLLGSASATMYLGWRFRSHASDTWTRSPWVSAIALVGLYLCHIVPFAVVLLVHVLVAIPQLRAKQWRRVTTASVCLLPGLALLVAYLARGGTGGAQRRTLKTLVVDAVTLREVLVAFSSSRELIALVGTLAVIAFVGGALLVRRRDLSRSQPARLAATAAMVLAVLYWMVPTNVSGGGFLTARVALFAIIMALAAASALSPKLMRVVPVIALVSLIGTVALRQEKYSGFSDDIQELMEARQFLNTNTVVLTLVMCDQREQSCASSTATAIAPLSEASGLLMAETGAADVTLYEGFFKFFPLQFREATSPSQRLFVRGTDPSDTPPSADVAAYERTTGVKIDVIVVWGWTAVATDRSIIEIDPLRAALTGYRAVYTSTRSHVTVFKRVP